MFRFSALIPALLLAALLSWPAAGQAQSTANLIPDAPAAPASEAEAEADALDPALAALLDPSISNHDLRLQLLPLFVSDLKALADAWQDVVKRETQAVVDAQLALAAAEAAQSPDVETARATLDERLTARNVAFDSFSTVVTSFEAKGGAAEEVAAYRAYRSSIFLEETQTADFETLVRRAWQWSIDPEGGLQSLIRVGVVLGALVGLILVARIVRGLVRRGLRRIEHVSRLLQAFIGGIAYWLTIAIGLMVVLSVMGINITPLFALVGGASFIIAFAMQDTLGNLAAGVMIMINRPFDEGDYVTVAGTGGTVKSVSVVSTTVTTPDNQVIVIPNSKVWGDIITNVTASSTRRVDLVFGIGYDDSIEEAQKVLERVVGEHPLVLDDPAPVIRVNALGASSVDFVCRPWVKIEDYWTVYWDLTRSVKEAFDAAGISIPFPQTDMHLHLPGSAALPIAAVAQASQAEYAARPDRVHDIRTGAPGEDEAAPAPDENR